MTQSVIAVGTAVACGPPHGSELKESPSSGCCLESRGKPLVGLSAGDQKGPASLCEARSASWKRRSDVVSSEQPLAFLADGRNKKARREITPGF